MSILGQEEITLRRRTSTVAWGSDFRATAPTTADSTILASVQPMGERDMQNLTEGQRQRSPRKIYTTTALRTVDQDTAEYADLVVIDSEVFQVQSMTRHRSIIPHYRGVLLRLLEEDG